MLYEKLCLAGKEIYLIGTEHTKNLKDLINLKERIQKIKPNLILVEGNFDKADFPSDEVAMSFGEMAIITFFAKKNKISLKSNDPSNKSQENFVSKEFSENISRLYFLLRDNLGSIKEDNEKEISILMSEVLRENFDKNKDYSDYFDPTKKLNLFNRVTRKLNNFRDDFMRQVIKESFNDYSRILVVKGKYHIFSELPKLRKELNED